MTDPLSPPLSKREIRWGQTLLVAFVLLVSLPYLWCALITPPGMVWGGLFFSADDQNVHLMWAKQAQGGALFIRDLFTTEGLVSRDRPLFFNLFALAVGWMARLTGLDVVVWYHIARAAFAGLFVHQLHKLLVAATGGLPERENARLGALALATLTTGGGLLYIAFPGLIGKVIFLDHPQMGFVTVPEAFALLSALIYPLNIASFALLCFLLCALLENRGPAKAFVAALVLANIHTYDALPLLLTCVLGAGWALARREVAPKKLRVVGAVVMGLLIPVAYQAIVFRGSPEFRVKALTATSPPVIWAIATTFAPLLLLAIAGRRTKWVAGSSLWLWLYAASVLLCVYAPKHPALLFEALFVNHPRQQMEPIYLFSFARKMLEGLQIPLLVFAGAGLAALPARKVLAPLVVGVLTLSPLMFWLWTYANFAENNVSRLQYWMPPYSLSDADAGALLALREASAGHKEQAVLCTPLLGSYIPRATGLFTYTGHWAETLHVNRKMGVEARFYAGQLAPSEARAFLRDNRIGFVVESPFERQLAGGHSTAGELGLRPIYTGQSRDGTTVVYAVG